MKIRILLVAVVVVSYLFAAPYIIANKMLSAARNYGSETLIARIDFSAVQASLRNQLRYMLAERLPMDLQRFILAAIRIEAEERLTVSAMIDMCITPESLTSLFTKMKADSDAGRPIDLFGDVSMGWLGFDEFSINVRKRREVKFILTRENVISWKITAAILPLRRFPLQQKKIY